MEICMLFFPFWWRFSVALISLVLTWGWMKQSTWHWRRLHALSREEKSWFPLKDDDGYIQKAHLPPSFKSERWECDFISEKCREESYFNFNIVWNFMLQNHWKFIHFSTSAEGESTKWYLRLCFWDKKTKDADDAFSSVGESSLQKKTRERARFFCASAQLPSRLMNLFPAHSSIHPGKK